MRDPQPTTQRGTALDPKWLGVLIVAGILPSFFMKFVHSLFQKQQLSEAEYFFFTFWFALLFCQFAALIWLPKRPSDDSATSRQKRLRRANLVSFELGMLPVLLYFSIFVRTWRATEFEMTWLDAPLWINLVSVASLCVIVAAIASLPLKCLTIFFYGDIDDRPTIVWKSFVIANLCLPFLFLL